VRVLRSRLVAGTVLLAALVAGAYVLRDGGTSTRAQTRPASDTRLAPATAAAATVPSTATTTSTTTTLPHDPARTFDPRLVRRITGRISPKSVTATGTGLVTAQNMMYTHTITVYDRDGTLVKTIPDSVDLAKHGYAEHPGLSRGAPVEAAADRAGRYVFASNYAMYGANFGPEGDDDCGGPAGLSRSFVYRVDVGTLAIDGVARVGMVPKFVAVTPDDRRVLVTNWCSFDLSVVDYRSLQEVRRVALGRYPRGIAVDPASTVAYVAVMGSYDIARVDLRTFAVSWIRGVGSSPRHVVLSTDGTRLFVTLNGAGQVVAVDTATGQVVARAATGRAPRSLAMSSDGRALYVVNYESNTVSVLRSTDLGVVRTIPVGSHPIGVTYEPVAHRLWVACYGGEILVYDA
jgi:YVTN family beta-propeller protein